VAFAIDRVLLWRHLDAAAPRPADAVYDTIDAGPDAREHFAVAEIGPKPAADHVVMWSLPPGTAWPSQLHAPARAEGDAVDADLRAAMAKALQRPVGAVPPPRTLYRETGDFAE
jgi:hypothetical protein